MHQKHKIHTGTFLSLCFTLLLLITIPQENFTSNGAAKRLFPSLTLGGYGARAADLLSAQDAGLARVAMRLSARIAKHHGTSPPLSALVTALKEQRILLRHHTTVTLRLPSGQALTLPDNPAYRTWEVSLQEYPTWLAAEISPAAIRFRIDESRIDEYLTREKIDGIIPPHDITITAVEDKGDIRRVVTSTGAARPGIVFDMPKTTEDLKSALTEGTDAITLQLVHAAGQIDNASDVQLGELQLLGLGKSDFRGSPAARISNVRKALNEHISNVLIPQGATFSFNSTLGGPITESRGWKLAKVIFNTTDLVMAPGGGICQVSTTTFRAMLQAGFTPVKRANHSMYVSYYEKYGVGIDATVFPGQQDLTFVNDTLGPLLLQAYDEGTEAIVQIYGTPDGRSTEILGPYFASSDLTGFPEGERSPRSNEIAWVQNVSRGDGQQEQHIIVSRYTALPKSLAKKYDTLRASAPPASFTATVTQR